MHNGKGVMLADSHSPSPTGSQPCSHLAVAVIDGDVGDGSFVADEGSHQAPGGRGVPQVHDALQAPAAHQAEGAAGCEG